MQSTVDLIVIGTGAAAGSVTYTCRAAGWGVTVVDSRPFGGTCQLRGCDPKKVLVGGAELAAWNRRMQGHCVAAGSPTIDWPELMHFKRTFTDPVPEQNGHSLDEAGIGMVHGRARVVDGTSLRVGDETLVGRHVVIAGGARRATLNILGEERQTTSTLLGLRDEPRQSTLGLMITACRSLSCPASPGPSGGSRTVSGPSHYGPTPPELSSARIFPPRCCSVWRVMPCLAGGGWTRWPPLP